MKYINPYDLAFVINFYELDANNYKKFKRKLFAELELFDDEIKIKNRIYTRNECHEVLDYIDKNKRLLNSYFAIYFNEKLNNFLYEIYTKEYLRKIKNDIKLEEEVTKELIFPFMQNIFIKIYKEAFLKNDNDILRLEIPLNESYKEDIYNPVYKILKNQENELISLKNNSYDSFSIKSIIQIQTINSLPNYFNKIRDDITYAIRNLSIDSWNDNQDMKLALELIDLALQLNASNKVKEKLLSDKEDLNRVKKEEYSLNKILEVDNIMKDSYSSFNQKLQSILSVINNIGKDDIIARGTFNLVMNNLDKNTDELIGSLSSLKQVLNRLLILSEDWELKGVINKNLKDLELVENKIEQSNNESDYGWIWWIVGFFIIANIFGK